MLSNLLKQEETHLVKNNLLLGSSSSDWRDVSPIEEGKGGGGREVERVRSKVVFFEPLIQI